MPTISIIMPVYNSAKTVGRMVDSILCQTYSDFELIAVNDGSTDSSLSILRDYACQDSRIVIIDKPNGGVASARQAGMNVMHGKYFIHADSDDWVENDMLELMLISASENGADIVICDYYVDHNGKSQRITQNPGSLMPYDVLYNLHANIIFGGLCHKLISTDCYIKSCAQFIEGIDYCEDKLLLTQILSRVSCKISYLNSAFYHYQVQMNSITRKKSVDAYNNIKRYMEFYPTLLPTCQINRYDKIFLHNKLELFISAFMNDAFDCIRTSQEFSRVKSLAFKEWGIRWKIGGLFILCRMPKLAKLLIRY